MQVSPAFRTMVRGFNNSNMVAAARHLLPRFDRLCEKIENQTYPDGTHLSPDEAAIIRIVFIEALMGKIAPATTPIQALSSIFCARSGESEPMGKAEVRALAQIAFTKREMLESKDELTFVPRWAARHFASLDELLEVDERQGL